MADRSGIAAALAAVGAGDVPAMDGGGEQLELVPELPGPLPEARDGRAAKAAGAGRGVGRPKGSRNRRSEEMIRYLTDGCGYRPPLQVLAETWSRPAAELARALDIDEAEAFKLQQQAAVAALPYWHERKPQAFEVASDHAGMLAVFMGSPDAPAGVAMMPLGPDLRSEQKQRVIDAEPLASDDTQSDDGDNTNTTKGLDDAAT